MLQHKLPDIALASGVGATSYAWLGTANEVATFIAAVVGIIMSLVGGWYYLERALDLHAKNVARRVKEALEKESEDDNKGEETVRPRGGDADPDQDVEYDQR